MERLKSVRLGGSRYHVLVDPPGPKIGSGGSTLVVLDALSKAYGAHFESSGLSFPTEARTGCLLCRLTMEAFRGNTHSEDPPSPRRRLLEAITTRQRLRQDLCDHANQWVGFSLPGRGIYGLV